MPINDAVAGPEAIHIPEDKTTVKARSLFDIQALYMQALFACPNPLRNAETCEACTLPLKSECDMYGSMIESMDEGGKH